MHGRHGYGHGRRRDSGRTAHLLEPAILVSLMGVRAHGYALAEALAGYGLGGTSLRRIYRLLRTMEEQGWVVSDWDTEQTQGPPRRVYTLTPGGEAVLADWVVYLTESGEAIERLLGEYRRHRS